MGLKKPFVFNMGWCIAGLGIAWALKYHYSIAGADDLRWILSPTAILVEMLTGHGFYFSPDAGYICHDLQICIAPACAGVNFLITAFCVAYFSSIFHFSGWGKRFSWLLGCAAGSYLITLFVNTIRIRVSIFLITADIHAGWLTPPRVHRIGGIVIYFFFLILFYHIIQKIIQRRTDGKQNRLLRKGTRLPGFVSFGILPLTGYWTMTIAVPWLNGAYAKNPAGFVEHTLTVGVLPIGILVGIFGILFLARRLHVIVKS